MASSQRSFIYIQWILFCSVEHQPTKTAIGVRLTMPSSPPEFFKVFLQKVKICVTFHLLEFILCNGPVTFCVLGVDTSNWI